jgi:hypothetical protein
MILSKFFMYIFIFQCLNGIAMNSHWKCYYSEDLCIIRTLLGGCHDRTESGTYNLQHTVKKVSNFPGTGKSLTFFTVQAAALHLSTPQPKPIALNGLLYYLNLLVSAPSV